MPKKTLPTSKTFIEFYVVDDSHVQGGTLSRSAWALAPTLSQQSPPPPPPPPPLGAETLLPMGGGPMLPAPFFPDWEMAAPIGGGAAWSFPMFIIVSVVVQDDEWESLFFFLLPFFLLFLSSSWAIKKRDSQSPRCYKRTFTVILYGSRRSFLWFFVSTVSELRARIFRSHLLRNILFYCCGLLACFLLNSRRSCHYNNL